MLSKLDAVNSIIQNLGVAKVTSLDVSNVDVQAALGTIERFTLELQATKWWFNTEYNVKLAPDLAGYVYLPPKLISVDTSERYGERIIQRGDKLYNVHQRTYKFKEAVEVNMTLALDWEELPYNARSVVMYSSMYQVQSDYEGDAEKLAKVQEQALGAYNTLKREHLNQLDINKFQSPHVSRVLNRNARSGSSGMNIGGRVNGEIAAILGV